MTVASEEELRGLLAQGWKLYWHSSRKRWYAYKFKEANRIVDASLDGVCQVLHKEKPKVSVGELQRRRTEGQTTERIAADVGLCETAVSNAMERSPDDMIQPREGSAAPAPETPGTDEAALLQEESEETLSNPGEPPKADDSLDIWRAAAFVGGASAVIVTGYILTNKDVRDALANWVTSILAPPAPAPPLARVTYDARPAERASAMAVSRGRYTVAG